jgi:hypothetical protein
MADNSNAADLAQRLQGRIDALSLLNKSLLTALVVRGQLTKEEVLAMIDEAEEALPGGGAKAAAKSELASIAADLPARLKAAAHPRVGEQAHDH